MIRRRFTTEEVWEKIDDFQGVICELLARYDYFSHEDEKHLENAADELTKLMYSLDDRLKKEKR